MPVNDDEQLARLFHETYERLAPSFSYETRKATAVPWDDVPEPNKSLMIAVASEVRAALAAQPQPDRYKQVADAQQATIDSQAFTIAKFRAALTARSQADLQARIELLHKPAWENGLKFCDEDGHAWPCRTIRLLLATAGSATPTHKCRCPNHIDHDGFCTEDCICGGSTVFMDAAVAGSATPTGDNDE